MAHIGGAGFSSLFTCHFFQHAAQIYTDHKSESGLHPAFAISADPLAGPASSASVSSSAKDRGE